MTGPSGNRGGDDVETRIGWRMAGLGMETASFVLGGVVLGWVIREAFGGGDVWIVVGAVAGIASGISQLIRGGLKLNRQLDRAAERRNAGSRSGTKDE
jgi:F0F1-type ATP synthase assembly protein I